MKISIITQPYKLCTKRETKVGTIFIKKDNVVTVCQSICNLTLVALLTINSFPFSLAS